MNAPVPRILQETPAEPIDEAKDSKRFRALLQAMVDEDTDFMERCEQFNAAPTTPDEVIAAIDFAMSFNKPL